VATFLVLPPRELLEHAVSEFVHRVLPSLPAPMGLTDVFLAHVVGGLGHQTYVVHREELPDGGNLHQTLCEAFGAEPGDHVIEIGPPRTMTPTTINRSRIPEASALLGGHTS
jgi:hypothetical protein